MKGNIKMHVQLDKHDITMICEALEFMAQDIIHAEQNGQTVAYSQDDVENLIAFLDQEEDDE
jgi:hypothetical protein